MSGAAVYPGPVAAPNLTDFTSFLQNTVGIPTTALPTGSAIIGNALQYAVSIVNTTLACVPGPIYALACYNLGTDYIIQYAMDQAGQTYFTDARAAFDVNTFQPGVIASSSNVDTSQSFATPDMLTQLSFADLQYLKTPYGRAYLALAQRYGSLWGLS